MLRLAFRQRQQTSHINQAGDSIVRPGAPPRELSLSSSQFPAEESQYRKRPPAAHGRALPFVGRQRCASTHRIADPASRDRAAAISPSAPKAVGQQSAHKRAFQDILGTAGPMKAMAAAGCSAVTVSSMCAPAGRMPAVIPANICHSRHAGPLISRPRFSSWSSTPSRSARTLSGTTASVTPGFTVASRMASTHCWRRA